MLNKVLKAMRISEAAAEAYGGEIEDLIESAQKDLEIAGVVLPEPLDAICEKAIITYCKLNFGIPEDYEKLKESYDEQKAQLVTATGYTDWGKANV